MVSRVGAAACAAAVVAVLAAPVQSSARGGGVAMGHVGGFHPPARSFHQVHPPSVQAHGAPLFRHDFLRHHAFRAAERRRHRGTFGFWDFGGYWGPLTYSGDGAFYGSYYDPSDFYGSYYYPSYMTGAINPPTPKVPTAAVVPVAAPEPQVVDRGGCRSETVALPSPGGTERSVTITRC